ncbi:Uncharacterized conserved protein, contains FIST_N domain [Aeromonas sp. RU39B]|uniref:FIST signal transduction protein n=1 Tax=Aeromonas sp. RU39B TaxID=1907416 RepID=UPI00095493A7|nr:FIST N-terminal domain-containing protein [Aeromonas sp. RU39B]SIQ14552.1 Uncharacterized conserved protein, contains FIST_N domain [Aeromonas sp. RU39B]
MPYQHEGFILNYITAHANDEHPELAARHIIDQLSAVCATAPSLLLLYFSCQYDGEVLRTALCQHFPTTPLMGCTSYQTVQSEQGASHGIAVAAFYDEQGSYGVAGGAGPDADVRQLLRQAMAACGRPGELPHLVLLHTSPGGEESLLAQIDAELGSTVPVIGGSAADNSLTGEWQLCWQQQTMHDGIVLAVFYPDCELVFQFHSGYMPTSNRGTITEVDGREVVTLDGRPAGDVYQQWLGRALEEGPILFETTLYPLARQVGEMYGMPYFKLSHPEAITERRGLRLFTDVAPGETLTLMQGSELGLLQRSLQAARIEPDYGMPQDLYPLGALIVFCAGCRLALSERVDDIASQFNERLGGVPYIMPFTFGEQGRLPQGELAHGNLMISSVIFCKGR